MFPSSSKTLPFYAFTSMVSNANEVFNGLYCGRFIHMFHNKISHVLFQPIFFMFNAQPLYSTSYNAKRITQRVWLEERTWLRGGRLKLLSQCGRRPRDRGAAAARVLQRGGVRSQRTQLLLLRGPRGMLRGPSGRPRGIPRGIARLLRGPRGRLPRGPKGG